MPTSSKAPKTAFVGRAILPTDSALDSTKRQHVIFRGGQPWTLSVELWPKTMVKHERGIRVGPVSSVEHGVRLLASPGCWLVLTFFIARCR